MALFRKRKIVVDKKSVEGAVPPEFSPWAHFKEQGVGSLISVLSGNPADDIDYSNLYKGLDASEYLSRINTFQKPVTRTTKSGEEKTYNTIWIEHERGAHVHFYVNSVGLSEDGEPIRVPVTAIASSPDPDFLERAFLGTDEERAAIDEEEFRQKVEITLTRSQEEITSENVVNGEVGTYFNMGWSAEAIQDDTTIKRDFMRHKGMSKPSGDHILHSASTIVWREPERVPLRHRVADKLRPWKEPRKADPDQFVSRIYYNEFGKLFMRLKEDDMKVGFIRWMMRKMSVELNGGEALSEVDSKKLMHDEFTKSCWSQSRFLHPYDMIEPGGNSLSKSFAKLGGKMMGSEKKGAQKFGAILGKTSEFFRTINNKHIKKIGSKTPQKFGHVFANFNKKGAIISAISGAAVGVMLVGLMYVLGAVKVAASAAARFSSWAIVASMMKKGVIGVGKGGAKVLSPIVPLSLNKRFDKTPVIADHKPKLRQNDDLGGWTFNFKYLKHAVALPYDFVADTYPDAPVHTKQDRQERLEEMMINPDCLVNGSHGYMREEAGFKFFVAEEPTGIRRRFDTASLTAFVERIGDPCAYSALDGVLKEQFDAMPEGDSIVGVRWKDFWSSRAKRITAQMSEEDMARSEEPTLITLKNLESVPDDFIIRRTKSIEEFEAQVCSLNDFDTADFEPDEYLSAKQLKKIAKDKSKQQKEQAKLDKAASIHRIEFERKAMRQRLRARAANENLSVGQRSIREFYYDDHGIG